MRFGVLADVHGNLPALEAVLDRLRDERVERLLCLGDLVGYGPFPNECVDRIAELGATSVAGNHDLIAVGRLDDRRCSGLARETLRWTRDAISEPTRRYLDSLPLSTTVGDEIVMAHGALRDPDRYVRRPDEMRSELAELASDHPEAALLLLGHTHVSAAYGEERGLALGGGSGKATLTAGERFLLNPGSVGQSRTWSPAASVLVVDLRSRAARFHRVTYDMRAVRTALAERGLPTDACHERPPAWRAAARTVRVWAQRIGPPAAK